MDPFTQLLGGLGGLFLLVGFLMLTAGLPFTIWLFWRACRDLHGIRESLHWIAHCTPAPEPQVQAARPAATPPRAGISISQFGR